jgi:starvation-inducible DNA-binding protein
MAIEIAPHVMYAHETRARIALARRACEEIIASLNQILADTMTLRDLYRKHLWQASGPAFYSLHLVFDKHHGEQEDLTDIVAERIQALGGTPIVMAADVAETTILRRPPRSREAPAIQLMRLADAHERVLAFMRNAAHRAAELGDDGTHDVLVDDVIRINEEQSRFVRGHLQ